MAANFHRAAVIFRAVENVHFAVANNRRRIEGVQCLPVRGRIRNRVSKRGSSKRRNYRIALGGAREWATSQACSVCAVRATADNRAAEIAIQRTFLFTSFILARGSGCWRVKRMRKRPTSLRGMPRIFPPGLKPAAHFAAIAARLNRLEKLGNLGGIEENWPSVAKATCDSVGFLRGLKPSTPSVLSFSAACKVAP